MNVYALAIVERQTYGHGDFGSEDVIKRTGAYGSGPLPPLFRSREAAQKFLDSRKERWPTYKIVPMQLED